MFLIISSFYFCSSLKVWLRAFSMISLSSKESSDYDFDASIIFLFIPNFSGVILLPSLLHIFMYYCIYFYLIFFYKFSSKFIIKLSSLPSGKSTPSRNYNVLSIFIVWLFLSFLAKYSINVFGNFLQLDIDYFKGGPSNLLKFSSSSTFYFLSYL